MRTYSPVEAREWNAGSYDAISAPQQEWGATVVERLDLRGEETVLDAGAGTGLVTEMVLERLPRGRVIAVDASCAMVERARERLPAERTTVLCADLETLELPAPLDAIISTATFHWILDHDALFARMRALLAPGGQFVVQCGGDGNLDAVRAIARDLGPPFAPYLEAMPPTWNYATAQATRSSLERAGFAVSAVGLEPRPTVPPHPREFMETVIFRIHLMHLPPELRDPFLDAMMQRLPTPAALDYVRLNFDASAI